MNDTAAVLQAAPPVPVLTEVRATPTLRRLLLRLLAVAMGAVLLGYVFPRLVGTTAADVAAVFRSVSGRQVVMLTGLWAAGLLTHSFVLTGALPGLTRRRALTLNLTGSAVANTMPFGGAAGMSMNYVMVRAWGVESAAFAAFTLVTNAWGVLLKLAMPAMAVAALWATGGTISHAIRWSALVSLGVLAVVLLLGIAALASRRTAQRAAGAVASVTTAAARVLRRTPDPARTAGAVLACRDTVASVLVRRWGQLTVGTVGYGLLQAVLLWACLDVVGARLAPAVVLAGYAVDRVVSLLAVTPGGAGLAEAGTAAVLIALGGGAAPVAAGVLLYRGFTFALEIPVGGAWLAGWLLWRRRGRAAAGTVT